MEILRSIPELERLRGTAFFGDRRFDGVHRVPPAVISTSADHAVAELVRVWTNVTTTAFVERRMISRRRNHRLVAAVDAVKTPIAKKSGPRNRSSSGIDRKISIVDIPHAPRIRETCGNEEFAARFSREAVL